MKNFQVSRKAGIDMKIKANKSQFQWIFLMLFTVFIVLTFGSCNLKPREDESEVKPDDQQEQQEEQEKYSKLVIDEKLAANKELFDITWSPDDTKAIYIQPGTSKENGLDEAYLWQVGKENPELIREVTPTTYSFIWSPDSRYFLIREKLGEGSINSIVNAGTLTEESHKIKSISAPAWSSDSQSLAYGYEHHDYGESWGSLEVYTIGAKTQEYIWKAKNYLYKIDSWDEQGNINYTEINDKGEESKKSTKNIRASIAGVHLGDTKEQVIAVLGNEYKETKLGEEMGHFPEKLYSLEYDGDLRMLVGVESDTVLEISTTTSKGETNLGISVGDTAAQVFAAYRPEYIEPESIHGGKLYGFFKVEGAAAMVFNFNLRGDQSREEIKPENKVEMIVLTYPAMLDDDF